VWSSPLKSGSQEEEEDEEVLSGEVGEVDSDDEETECEANAKRARAGTPPSTATERSIATVSDPSRYPSTVIGAKTSSTKLRVCHLSVLLQSFRVGGARKLKDDFMQMRVSTCMVLHGCGCGLTEKGGCVEPTHLRLGTREENSNDEKYHQVLRDSEVALASGRMNLEDYKALVVLLRKACNREPFL